MATPTTAAAPLPQQPMLDRRSQQVSAKTDDRHQCSHQQAQPAPPGLAAAGPTTEAASWPLSTGKEFPMAHGLDKEQKTQQGHQTGEHHLQRGVVSPAVLVVIGKDR